MEISQAFPWQEKLYIGKYFFITDKAFIKLQCFDLKRLRLAQTEGINI